MPTIVDSLVVTLSLDPRNFTDEQKKAVEELRKLEERSKRTGQGVDETGQAFVRFFRGVQSPMAAMRAYFERLAITVETPKKKLNDLGAQGKRTGETVEAGALAGAAGLRALGIAGTAAFATIVALDKLMTTARTNAQKLYQTGTAAATAGVPIREFTAVAQALYKNGNVPEEQTYAFLGQLRQARNAVMRGDPGLARQLQANLSIAAAQAGVPDLGLDVFHDDPITTQNKIAAAFARMTEDQAIGFGQSVGMTDEQARGLRQVGSRLPEYTAAERRRAATDDQEKAAGRLTRAFNNLEIELGNIWRHILQPLDIILARILENFGGFLTTLTKLFTGEGLTEEDKAFVPFSHAWWMKKYNEYFGGGKGAGGSGSSGDTPGNLGAGSDGPYPSGGSAAPSGARGDPRGMEMVIRRAAVANGMNPDDWVAIGRREGMGAANYGTWDVNGMSYGALQAHSGPYGPSLTGRSYGMADAYYRATGKNPADPNNEADLNAWLIHWASIHGVGPWSAVSSGRAIVPRRLTPEQQQAYRKQYGMDAPPLTPTSGPGAPPLTPTSGPGEYEPFNRYWNDPKRWWNSGELLRQDTSSTTNTTTSTDQSTTVHVDNLHVHTQATRAEGISAAAVMAAKASANVSAAKRGLN